MLNVSQRWGEVYRVCSDSSFRGGGGGSVVSVWSHRKPSSPFGKFRPPLAFMASTISTLREISFFLPSLPVGDLIKWAWCLPEVSALVYCRRWGWGVGAEKNLEFCRLLCSCSCEYTLFLPVWCTHLRFERCSEAEVIFPWLLFSVVKHSHGTGFHAVVFWYRANSFGGVMRGRVWAWQDPSVSVLATYLWIAAIVCS